MKADSLTRKKATRNTTTSTSENAISKNDRDKEKAGNSGAAPKTVAKTSHVPRRATRDSVLPARARRKTGKGRDGAKRISLFSDPDAPPFASKANRSAENAGESAATIGRPSRPPSDAGPRASIHPDAPKQALPGNRPTTVPPPPPASATTRVSTPPPVPKSIPPASRPSRGPQGPGSDGGALTAPASRSPVVTATRVKDRRSKTTATGTGGRTVNADDKLDEEGLYNFGALPEPAATPSPEDDAKDNIPPFVTESAELFSEREDATETLDPADPDIEIAEIDLEPIEVELASLESSRFAQFVAYLQSAWSFVRHTISKLLSNAELKSLPKRLLDSNRNRLITAGAAALVLAGIAGIALSGSPDEEDDTDAKVADRRNAEAKRKTDRKSPKAEGTTEAASVAVPDGRAESKPAPSPAGVPVASADNATEQTEDAKEADAPEDDDAPEAFEEDDETAAKLQGLLSSPAYKSRAADPSSSSTSDAKPPRKSATKPKPVKAPRRNGDPNQVPVRLSRAEVQAGMNRVARRVKKCGSSQSRPVVMSVTIGRTGRVTSAVATGSFAGTPVGACVAKVIRTATFPQSQQALTVKYPFHL